jgi:gag-polypeptide of LTR copia-type
MSHIGTLPDTSGDDFSKSESVTLPTSFLEELTTRITKAVLQTHLSSSSGPTKSNISKELNQAPSIRFNGRNYWLWTQMVDVYLSSKKKMGYITGAIKRPNEADDDYEKWHTEDAMVRNWLLNSLEPSHLANFVGLRTAKDVWDGVRVGFFDASDGTQLYELQMRVWGLKQAGGSLEEYYNTLVALWREIDYRRPCKLKNPEDIKENNLVTQQDRIHILLGGLDNRLDSIRAEILRLRPLPTVEEAFGLVRREDVRQGIMGGKMNTSNNSMAMLAQGNLSLQFSMFSNSTNGSFSASRQDKMVVSSEFDSTQGVVSRGGATVPSGINLNQAMHQIGSAPVALATAAYT